MNKILSLLWSLYLQNQDIRENHLLGFRNDDLFIQISVNISVCNVLTF